MMIENMLIVRGVRTTDDLQMLGLPIATKYAKADMAVLVGSDGRGQAMKGVKSTVVVEFIDADPSIGHIMRAMKMIKATIEEADPENAHLSHEAVGLFLYYWIDTETLRPVSELAEEGNWPAIDRAAQSFIEKTVGNAAGQKADDATLSSEDGDSDRDAAGHSPAD